MSKVQESRPTRTSIFLLCNGRGPDHCLIVSDGTRRRRQHQSVDTRPFRPRPPKSGSWFGLVLFRTHARTPARPEDGSRHTDIHRAPGKKRSGGSRCVLSFCKSVRSCRRRGRKSLFGAMSHHTHGRGKSLEEKAVMGRAWGTGEGLRRKNWMVVCGRMLLMGAVTRSNPSSSRLERIEGIELRRR